LIIALPPVGTTASSDIYTSYPAARWDPFLGITASSMSFLTNNLLTCLQYYIIFLQDMIDNKNRL